MSRLTMFISKPFVKSALLGGVTLVIGGICSALGSWDYINDSYFFIKIIVLVVSIMLYLVLLAVYSTLEAKQNKIYEIYKKQNDTFGEVMSGLISISITSARDVNKVIHKIVDTSKADMQLWSFDSASQLICNKVYDILKKIGYGDDFEIIYIRLDESLKDNQIYLSGYANKRNIQPSIGKCRRSLEKAKVIPIMMKYYL